MSRALAQPQEVPPRPPRRLAVQRHEEPAPPAWLDDVIEGIDQRAGMFHGCDYESEPIYQSRARAFCDPSVRLAFEGGRALLAPLDATGAALVDFWARLHPGTWEGTAYAPELVAVPGDPRHPFMRLLRALAHSFEGDCRDFGFHGAWNFEHWKLRDGRAANAANAADKVRVVLYLPMTLLSVRSGAVRRIVFTLPGLPAAPAPRAEPVPAPRAGPSAPARDDFRPGEYAARLATAIERIRAGELMSLTLTQAFRRPFAGAAAPAFRALRSRYPMPEMYFVNLGSGERLLGASPDLQARVADGEVECAPVCGTLPRGEDALEDAALGKELLGSAKEGAALALCSDSFADSLAAVCVPGSLRIASRQRIHFFGSVIHAVDHLKGRLAPSSDVWDVLLATSAPPTVTGVPKQAALGVIEQVEGSPRGWFGGAVGYVGFDGSLGIGSIMRQAWFHDGVVELRAGGVIVSHSTPAAEEAESQTKARKLMQLLGVETRPDTPARVVAGLAGRRVDLLHNAGDPFAHALRDAMRACGAAVERASRASAGIPLVVSGVRPGSVGPAMLAHMLEARQPLLLVGGAAVDLLALLGVRSEALPMATDGYTVRANAVPGELLQALGSFEVGVYEASRVGSTALPPACIALATSDEGALRAYRLADRRVAGLLFRPESILSGRGDAGRGALGAALRFLLHDPAFG